MGFWSLVILFQSNATKIDSTTTVAARKASATVYMPSSSEPGVEVGFAGDWVVEGEVGAGESIAVGVD